jgi:hypothetical protein
VNSLGGSSLHSFQSDQGSFPLPAILTSSASLVDYVVDPFDRETDASQIRMSVMDPESSIEQWRNPCLVQALHLGGELAQKVIVTRIKSLSCWSHTGNPANC